MLLLPAVEACEKAFGAMQRELKQISRDALAGVLGVTGERGVRIEGVRVLDIRRHDERALYGSIPGTGLSRYHCGPWWDGSHTVSYCPVGFTCNSTCSRGN